MPTYKVTALQETRAWVTWEVEAANISEATELANNGDIPMNAEDGEVESDTHEVKKVELVK